MDRIAFIWGQTFIYWRPVILALAVLAAALVFIGLYLGRSGNWLGAFCAVPLAIVLASVLGRLVHWYCRADSYPDLLTALTDYATGDYALAGVFAGCFLAAAALRITQATKDLPQMLDCMCLAGAMGIGLGRMACLYGSADRGDILQGFTRLPLAYPVVNSVTGQTEYRLATFMLQAMVVGAIFIALLVFWFAGRKRSRSGDTCLLFLLLYGATQAVLDSTRYDSLFLRSNGFVSIVQILSAAAVVLASVIFAVRLVRARGWRWWYLALWVPTLGLLGCAGYMEYYVQRHGDQALFAYTVMSGCMLGVIALGVAAYTLSRRKKAATPALQQ